MKKILFVLVLFACTQLQAGSLTIPDSSVYKLDTLKNNKKLTVNNNIELQSLFNQKTIHTPEVSALIRNILYPVNYSTGVVNISIPLFEIQCGNLRLPIKLNYHASGVKVSENSGWVGLNWQIEAEPMISHVIKGKSDEEHSMICDFNINQIPSNQQRYYISMGNPDEQPDEYYYQICGKSGLFMYALEHYNTPTSYVTFPYENLKITWNGHFTITDDDGTLYDFNGSVDRGLRFGQSIVNTTDGWHASSIISADKCDTITFSYNSQATRCLFEQNNDNIIVIDNFQRRANPRYTSRLNSLNSGYMFEETCMKSPIILNTIGFTTKGYQLADDGTLFPDHYEDTWYYETSGYTESHHLQEIRYKGGRVVFSSRDNQVLDNIQIYDTNGNLVRRIDFTYSSRGTYFPRYYLLGVKFSNGTSSNSEIYSFDYYNQNNFIHVGSKSIDYWGYYNGVNRGNNESLVTERTITAIRDIGSDYYQDEEVELTIGSPKSRESNEDYMIYGSLKRITYPTGASDEFTYEANRKLDSNTNEIIQVGGLRIKQIKTILSTDSTNIRTFIYGEDGCGYGITPVYDSDEYYYNEKSAFYYDPQCGITCGSSLIGNYMEARQRIYNSEPFIPITFEGGASVMYDYVTEYNGTLNNNTGKTVYTYNINYVKRDSNPWSTMQQKEYKDRLYGQLLSKSIYKATTNGYKLIEKTVNNYTTANKNFGKIYCGEVELTGAIRKSCGYYNQYESLYDYVLTSINVVPMLLSSSVHSVFDNNNNEMCETTTYEYDLTAQIHPTKETSVCTDGSTYITSYKYAADYSSTTPYSTMLANNILSPVISISYNRGNGYYLEKKTPLNSLFKIASVDIRYSNNGSWQNRYSYIYNSWGNRVQASKDNRENIVFLYGYNRQHIIAVIENSTYNEVKEILGESTLYDIESANQPSQSQWNLINNLRTSLPDAHITTYQYQPLVGVTVIIDPSGHVTKYTYDGLGRLVTKKIVHNGIEEIVEKYDYHYITE